jgi:hypothetical protein
LPDEADRRAALHDLQSPGQPQIDLAIATGLAKRAAALGFGWADVTATQVYTIFDIHPLLADEIVQSGRFDVAFRAPAGAGPRFRDGCTRRRPRIRDLTRYARHQKISAR